MTYGTVHGSGANMSGACDSNSVYTLYHSEMALLLALGAAHVSVVEYLPTLIEHINASGVKADDWLPAAGDFDVIVSMSRYGRILLSGSIQRERASPPTFHHHFPQI